MNYIPTRDDNRASGVLYTYLMTAVFRLSLHAVGGHQGIHETITSLPVAALRLTKSVLPGEMAGKPGYRFLPRTVLAIVPLLVVQ
jgi:hypothetical protein